MGEQAEREIVKMLRDQLKLIAELQQEVSVLRVVCAMLIGEAAAHGANPRIEADRIFKNLEVATEADPKQKDSVSRLRQLIEGLPLDLGSKA